jgi:plasmid stabilization system protein ParE
VRIVWSPEAADDFEQAVEYVAQDNPTAAAKLAHGLLGVVERLATDPIDHYSSSSSNR